jgi:hypothetical protein
MSERGVVRTRKGILVILGSVLGVIVIAAVTYFLVKPGSKSPSSAASSASVVETAISRHQFLTPECAPITSRRWVYPGPVGIHSTMYESFSLSYPCATAKSWITKLIKEKIPFSKNGALVPVHGPAGYSCGAWADANGYAYAGGCQKGTHAFGWNWNVANPHDYFVPNANGHLELEKGEGSDSETIVTTLSPTRYQLEVMNTSGIGFINHFIWTPPAGWTIASVTGTSGAKCEVTTSGQVSCVGQIGPPTCLCTGGGGAATVDFTISKTTHGTVHGHPNSTGSVGATTKLVAMTAVPYLIPGTPQEAARQTGQ